MAVPNTQSGKSGSCEGSETSEYEEYDYGADWDNFPEQVKTYSFLPLPRTMCRTGLWLKKADGLITTAKYTNYYGFGVLSGMEDVNLLTIGHVSISTLLNIRPRLHMFKKKLERGDVLLEMNGEPLCGSGTSAPYLIMKMLWNRREMLTIKVVSRKLLKNCIGVSQFLHDNVFSKSSLHYQIQLSVRANLYAISAPITNRPRREDDLPPEQGGYLFVDNARLYRWVGRQFFVEAGEYEGKF
ncbi:hypothetical protein RvY_02998-2 [Ramazzottius varieornatus]|uniref:Uncharacterized protein n=1 Tax=Ramazzottius varieornatus TaxID=947166 RepID=A0A1D1ULM1_RAMVA|nr:hypothetical protein RvY_02998-2 [Ramazzottius varieornatus]